MDFHAWWHEKVFGAYCIFIHILPLCLRSSSGLGGASSRRLLVKFSCQSREVVEGFREEMEGYEEVKGCWMGCCVLVNSALVVLSPAREREIVKLFQEKWENICFNRVIVHIFAK